MATLVQLAGVVGALLVFVAFARILTRRPDPRSERERREFERWRRREAIRRRRGW